MQRFGNTRDTARYFCLDWLAYSQGYDLIEDMYSAKTAAMNLVAELCKQRSKGNLDPFMHFLVQVMTEYQVSISVCFSVTFFCASRYICA